MPVITTRDQTPTDVISAAAIWNEEKAAHEEARAETAHKNGWQPSEVAVHRRDALHHWDTAVELRRLVNDRVRRAAE